MSRVSALERLQTIDQEIDEKTRRLHQVEQRLSADPALTVARTALAGAEKALAELRSTLRGREMDAQSLDSKIKGTEERLYGGRVSNPKELEGLEKELTMFKRQRSELDDQLLDLMERVEHAQADATSMSTALKQTEGTRAADVTKLSQEREALTARLQGLAAEREATRATLETDALRTYERLRQTKAGRAVSTIRNNACAVCGVTIPTGLIQRIHTGNELVFCSGCGRILAL